MQAAVLMAPGLLEVREADEPVAGPGEASLRVRAVGICGTDLSIYQGKIPVAHPRIMGHEIVGEVLSSPPGAPAPGSRVVVDPVIACGRCPRCREGRTNLCSAASLLGRDRDGALRDVVAVPAENLYEVPDDLEDHLAPLVQVLTTCVHAHRMLPVSPGERVAVVGLGVTGLLHVQLAKLHGAAVVVGVSRSQAKLELGRSLGADLAVPADADDATERVLEATAGGADLVIECAGTVATLGAAVRMARAGGRVLAYGTIAEGDGEFPYYDLYHKELVVASPRAARPRDFPVAIEMVASASVRLAPLVSRRVPLAALAGALPGTDGDLKTVVEMGPGLTVGGERG